MLYTLIVLQRNRQWNKSDVPLIVGKVTAHECNKRIVTRQTPNANVCTGSSEWYKRIVPLMGGHHETNVSMAKRSTVVTALKQLLR